MFSKPLEYIFLLDSLQDAYADINKHTSGIDEMDFREFEKELSTNLKKLAKEIKEQRYTPEPLKKIEIEKSNSHKKRPLALGSIKDKVVQRVLYENLNTYFDKHFSDKSYAYRPGKSTAKAINRVTQFLNQKKLHVVKTDIENFFETIEHDALLDLLAQHIKDKRIIKLISLFIQMGGFQKYVYVEHNEGVHQGDILSPLLSNIYLNEMDSFLEKKGVSFVRYADDFVMLFEKKQEAFVTLKELKSYLKKIHLKLNKQKTQIVHISDGFTFLGVHFKGKRRSVDNEHLQKAISKIHAFSKNKSGFAKFVEELNRYLFVLKNYYLKIIIKDDVQYKLLQDALIESVAHKIYLAKQTKKVQTKKEFRSFLAQIKFDILFPLQLCEDTRERALAKGLETYLANKSYKESHKKIHKKRDIYARKFANDATLHVQSFGFMLGISKNKFVLKQYGKVVKKYPLNKVERIIFEGKGFSFSSDVLQQCAKHNITVDFIDTKGFSYASLITYKASLSQHIYKQAMLLGTEKQLYLAKSFIRGKAKNQINYLKYLNKYHQTLDKIIDKMEKNFVKIQTASDNEVLMGIEGSISASYWQGISLVLEVPFEKRVTQGAKDVVNSSLNYAYAILYGKVQHALVFAGLSLNISFLHSVDGLKPTLTFDLIEEFRSFVVDRVVISMFNKEEPLKLGNDGLLTKATRKLIAKNIKEKLGSYTMWKKESRKVENIIQIQAYNLVKYIDGESKKYKPFIGKF